MCCHMLIISIGMPLLIYVINVSRILAGQSSFYLSCFSFFSGVLGSGLCLFSKWLIHDVFFHQWPLNGYIHKIHHGDWFGGKGIGLCRLKCNDIMINVYCTHVSVLFMTLQMFILNHCIFTKTYTEMVTDVISVANFVSYLRWKARKL